MNGFYALGKRARSLAEECCDGKLVLVQEGGYAISYAAYCLHATLEGVLNRDASLPDPLAYLRENTEGIDEFITSMKKLHALAVKR